MTISKSQLYRLAYDSYQMPLQIEPHLFDIDETDVPIGSRYISRFFLRKLISKYYWKLYKADLKILSY